MKLKRYKEKKISSYISMSIILVVISLILSFIVIDYFDNKVNEILFPMAESQTRKVIAMIINKSCSNVNIGDNLYEINKDSNNEIKMITYNSFEVTKLINQVTTNIENMISDIENGKLDYYGNTLNKEKGVIAEIPFGVIFGNSLLANVGPKIKLRVILKLRLNHMELIMLMLRFVFI